MGKKALSQALDIKYPKAAVGSIVEICQSGASIAKDIAEQIKKYGGGALFVDYGYDYYGYKDTLQAVKNHKYADILKEIGDADLTAHVDFIALRDIAVDAGLSTSGIITQGDLLRSLGIDVRMKALLKNAGVVQASEITGAVDRLINPDKMGTLFKAIAYFKYGN